MQMLSYNITSFHPLSQGQTLVSLGEIFELGFFTPKNSAHQYVGIWYKGISPQTVVQVANGANPIPTRNSRLPSIIVDANRNLELLNGSYNSIWSTNIQVQTNSSIGVLQENGNFLLKDALSGENFWQSFDNLGDTFLPSSMLGFNVKTGENNILTSWKSDTDWSLGNFTLELAQQKPQQVFIWINGSIPGWRSGLWDKSKFIGMPDMVTSYQSPHSMQENVDKGTTLINSQMCRNKVVMVTQMGGPQRDDKNK